VPEYLRFELQVCSLLHFLEGRERFGVQQGGEASVMLRDNEKEKGFMVYVWGPNLRVLYDARLMLQLRHFAVQTL
jgi:hypothetical protein